MCHEIAGGGILKIRIREFLQVSQQIVTQIELDMTRDDDDRLPRQECEHSSHDGESNDDQRPSEEIACNIGVVIDPGFQGVDRAAKEHGLYNSEEIAHNHCYHTPEERTFIAEKVWLEA
jgi:hypothetical protein